MKYFILITLLMALSSCGQASTDTEQNLGAKDTQPEVEDITEPIIIDASFTLAEVQIHNSKQDCWTIVDGNVYDVTSYTYNHPGGPNNILKMCGIDASEMFGRKHGESEKAGMKLDSFLIGSILSESVPESSD